MKLEYNELSLTLFSFPKIREERAAAAQLKLLNSPSFDYFARLKQTMQGTESEKHYSMASPTHEDEDYFKVQKAPLMSLLPGVNFINVLRMLFSYECCFGSFFCAHVTREKLPTQHSYKKPVSITLMSLLPGVNSFFLKETLC